MTEAVTEVAEAASSARYAVEASGAGARPDVVGDAVHVQLTNIIAVGWDDAPRSVHTSHTYIILYTFSSPSILSVCHTGGSAKSGAS